MKRSIVIGFVLCCVIGCDSSYKSEFVKSLDRLEQSAFEAGVQCAINAHLTYVQDELLKGNLPPRVGMDLSEWKKQSILLWQRQSTNTHIKLQ